MRQARLWHKEGFVPLTHSPGDGQRTLAGADSDRRCRTEGALPVVTSDLPFAEWTEVLGSERTGALLDRLTHHVHIQEMKATVSDSTTQNQPEAAGREVSQLGAGWHTNMPFVLTVL